MIKDIYILSGLGADERVFKYLHLPGFTAHHIKWVTPLPEETIEAYAKRLTAQIKTLQPILVGLSFGGMMAVEIAKHIKTEKIILIASSKTNKELPFYYRWVGKLGIHKLVSPGLLKRSNFLMNWAFGALSLPDKKLLNAILKDTDPVFLAWAIDK
jgi:pimeloyl-ACP methyl ester carboxylesterase